MVRQHTILWIFLYTLIRNWSRTTATIMIATIAKIAFVQNNTVGFVHHRVLKKV